MRAQATLQEWVAGRSVSHEVAEGVMADLLSGEVPDGLVGAMLTALQCKGVTGSELAGLAMAMRAASTRLSNVPEGLIDTCGTGGGGLATFNLSTAAAVIACAAGAKVAKHGNRGVTSACGSADVLEGLGVRLALSVPGQEKVLHETGLTFMFAQAHHPAMRHVIGVRKQLGIRTVFNLLGPLTNPAGARRQLIGLFDWESAPAVASALQWLGVERAFVVGAKGMDEVSPLSETQVLEVMPNEIKRYTWQPTDFGIGRIGFEAVLAGNDVRENGALLREAVCDANSPRSAAVVPNAACALMLAGLARTVSEGADLARTVIREGRAAAKLDQFIAATQGAE